MQSKNREDLLFSCLSAGHLVYCAKAAGANLLLELISGLEVSPVPEQSELHCQYSGTCWENGAPDRLPK